MIRYPATLIPFDVIMINGHYMTAEKLLDRKNALSKVVLSSPGLMLPTYSIGDGQRLFDWTLEKGWEGICAKNVSSSYRINRRPDKLNEAWVKRKHTEITEAFILGYQVNPFALVVGLPDIFNSIPVPVALVEYGFKEEEKIAFRRIAQQIHTEKKRNIQMVQPLLKCNVEYLERTNNGALRICAFRGFVV
jgi:bifunctional non-homologous end joining protein LigD